MQIMPPHPYANRLAQDLFDALWLEDLYGFRAHCTLCQTADGKTVLKIALDDIRSLHWEGQRADGLRPFRVLDPHAALHTGLHTAVLEISKAVETLQTAAWWSDRTGRFARFFNLAYDQAAFAIAHEHNIMACLRAAPDDLLSWEALSCLKDRPFHPLARAKGWNESDGYAYATETMASFSLHWVAVPRDRIVGTAFTGQPLAENLLNGAQQDVLANIARTRRADSAGWLWLPVHPWQWAWLNRSAPPKITGCIDLGAGPGAAIPTASLRSLAVTGSLGTHLKLALSVHTLGAIRALPPRYLHNGILAGACLESLRQRDGWLAAHLLLCDENQWWALSQRSQSDTLESEPGEMACMIRRYPALPGATLIPMAALPVVTADGELPAFNQLIGSVGQEEDAWRLFGDIARALLELGLRCFAQGVMPELHGQNVLLAFKDQQIVALVLRDHDTLRICRPLMEAQGVVVPNYIIDRSTPNTLELRTSAELLAYLQTLAIEVNLYAVLAALAAYYGREEAYGWHIVRKILESCLACIPLPAEIASQTKNLLLEEAEWPFKQLLAPLLGVTSFGTGMPSAMGRVTNPLLGTSLSSPAGAGSHAR
ncbi:MAG: IucA/IucC family protein [Nitrosospira sp.]